MSNTDYWDRQAASFDDAADHGLRDPLVRERWKQLLQRHLPGDGTALDVGCGTASLSLLLDELGYDVTGLDASPRMIEMAKVKVAAAHRSIDLHVGDAADPQTNGQRFDLVLGRHILWALPDPRLALERWGDLLRPGGRLALIEGFWHTGMGLRRTAVEAAMPSGFAIIAAEDLGADAWLWGAPVQDERHIVVAQRRG